MHVNGGRFEPPHVCVRVGQSLLIEQEDDDPHMIDVVSRFRAGGGRALPPDKSRRQTEVFSKPENGVILRCAVHFQERACVTVVPNAFHTMTGADGTFQLPGALPPGKYTLCAFHAELGRWLGEIEVPGDGSPVNVEIWYDPPPGPEGDK